MRITSQAMQHRVLADMQATQARVAKLQSEVSTQKRIGQASDDPLGTAQALDARTQLATIDRNQSSIADGTSRLNATDSALGQMSDLVARVRELTVLGANGATNAAGRAKIAQEIGQIADSLKDAANTKVGDVYVFGGTRTTTPPYQSGATDTYAGDNGTVARTVGPGVSVQVNVTGAQVLGSGGGDGLLLDKLRTIQANLTSGNTGALSTTDLQGLDAAHDALGAHMATVGATQNRLDAASSRLDDLAKTTNDVLNGVEGADLTTSLVQLSAQSTAYQAAMQTAAKVLQPSLLDFLR